MLLYTKTEAGRVEMHAREKALTPSQRQVLILCDGDRYFEDLAEMMPPETARVALDRLFAMGLVSSREGPPRAKPAEVVLTESERFRAMVELATSLAVDLGFTARIRAQLQIEKASTVADLQDTVVLLCKNLTEKHRNTPLMALRLNKLRQLAATNIKPG